MREEDGGVEELPLTPRYIQDYNSIAGLPLRVDCGIPSKGVGLQL